MQSITKYAAPNVVPGTNFNTQRFTELFAWMSALSADAVRSTMLPNRYGLLAAYDGRRSLQLEKTGNLLVLRRCAGITPAGRVVGIFEGTTPVLECPIDLPQLDLKEMYFVMIEVNGQKRNGFGQQANDQPERPAFTMPAYHINIQPTRQAAGHWADAFPIGVLQFEEGEWVLADYVPPCAHLSGHSLLHQKYREYVEAVQTLLDALPKIVRQTDSFRDKSMIELREFAIQCGHFLATQQPGIAALSASACPFDLLEPWLAFGRLVSFLLDCLKDRAGFYNLLYANVHSVNGVGFTPKFLDHTLMQLNQTVYNHQDIMATIEAIDGFLKLVTPMFKALGNGTIQPTGTGWQGQESRQSYASPQQPKPVQETIISSTW